MEVKRTAFFFKKRAPVPSTEKVLLGRLYEACAIAYCRRQKYRVLKTNWRLNHGEIDLLAQKASGELIVLEVRGKRSAAYLPSQMISSKKIATLRYLSQIVSRLYQRPARIELLEVVGSFRGVWMPIVVLQALARHFPERLGVTLTAFGVD